MRTMKSKILSIFEIEKIVIFTILTATLITCWSTNAHSDEGLIIKVQTVEKQLSNVLERLDQLENKKVEWQKLEMLETWHPYGSGYTAPQFFKDGAGFIHFRGLAKLNTTNSIVKEKKFATLPKEYRPTSNQEFVTACAGDIPCEIIFLTNGTVYLERGNSAWTSFDGISFFAGSTGE